MKNLFLLPLLCLASLTYAQQTLPRRYDRRDIGIATCLRGTVNVLSIYVSNSSAATPKLQQQYDAQLMKAERWLLDEAAAHGVNLEFRNFACGTDEPIVYDPVSKWDCVNPSDVIITAFGSEIKARNWLNLHPNCAVVIFVNTEKTVYCTANCASHAYTYDKPLLEGVKIYPYDMDDKYLEIAHEILHVFGAWDLYYGPVNILNKPFAKNESEVELWKKRLSQLRYSRDRSSRSIMFDVYSHDLYDKPIRHHVDSLTAYLVGWGGEWKDWYQHYAN